MASTYILAVGKMVEGEWQMDVAMPPLPDGALQDIIDEANADVLAEEWQDYFLEQEWLDHQL